MAEAVAVLVNGTVEPDGAPMYLNAVLNGWTQGGGRCDRLWVCVRCVRCGALHRHRHRPWPVFTTSALRGRNTVGSLEMAGPWVGYEPGSLRVQGVALTTVRLWV